MSRDIEDDRSVTWTFTATPKAIERFREALVYANGSLIEEAERLALREGTSRDAERAREHAGWLRWAISRVTYGEATDAPRAPR